MPRTINSRDFNQDVSAAKRLATEGPLVITDRGDPSFVLMTHKAYLRLVGQEPNIMDLLHDPKTEDFDFEIKRVPGERIRKVKFD